MGADPKPVASPVPSIRPSGATVAGWRSQYFFEKFPHVLLIHEVRHRIDLNVEAQDRRDGAASRASRLNEAGPWEKRNVTKGITSRNGAGAY
jgi:hypothetical protein